MVVAKTGPALRQPQEEVQERRALLEAASRQAQLDECLRASRPIHRRGLLPRERRKPQKTHLAFTVSGRMRFGQGQVRQIPERSSPAATGSGKTSATRISGIVAAEASC